MNILIWTVVILLFFRGIQAQKEDKLKKKYIKDTTLDRAFLGGYFTRNGNDNTEGK